MERRFVSCLMGERNELSLGSFSETSYVLETTMCGFGGGRAYAKVKSGSAQQL